MPDPLATRILAPDAAGIGEAARLLREGGLVAFPTETVYGLGADATNPKAVAALYDAKGRPSFNPLIAHVADGPLAHRLARFDDAAERLAKAFWPGPLTLVLPRGAACPVAELATAGLSTIGVRVPAHPVAKALLEELGRPVVAPSANRSGHVSPTQADHVIGDLAGRIDAVIDGGSTTVGVESTVVMCVDGTVSILRPGGITRAQITRVLGRAPDQVASRPDDSPLAPGQLASHYAPRARMRLRATQVEPGEALLKFGRALVPGETVAAAALNLSPRGDLVEAASNLFAHLRALDATGASTIAVAPIPDEGLGEAINDRLARAAAPR